MFERPRVIEGEKHMRTDRNTQMTDFAMSDLVERLNSLQEKAARIAAEQHDLTLQLQSAFKAVHELHLKNLEERNDLGGQG